MKAKTNLFRCIDINLLLQRLELLRDDLDGLNVIAIHCQLLQDLQELLVDLASAMGLLHREELAAQPEDFRFQIG